MFTVSKCQNRASISVHTNSVFLSLYSTATPHKSHPPHIVTGIKKTEVIVSTLSKKHEIK